METGPQGKTGMAVTNTTKKWTSQRWANPRMEQVAISMDLYESCWDWWLGGYLWQYRHLTFFLNNVFCLSGILQSVQQNGSLYIHVYFTKSGFHPDPKRKGQYRRLATVHATKSKFLWNPQFIGIVRIKGILTYCVFFLLIFLSSLSESICFSKIK